MFFQPISMSADRSDTESIANAEDYEKSFLERYFTGQANKKIADIREMMKNTSNPRQLESYETKIRKINEELSANLGIVSTENAPERLEDTEVDGSADEDDVFVHQGATIPRRIWNYLFAYQQEGVRWMIDLHMKESGGILADEMGLGKTIQAIAFISGLLISGHAEKALILCPATVVAQWAAEFRKACPGVAVSSNGMGRGRGVSIMSYEHFKLSMHAEPLDTVILDEGHKIKNRETQISRTVKSIRSRSRFVLTGTPIQNNLTELWSLFDFIVPGLLGTHLVFQEEFEERIKDKSDSNTSYRYSVMLRSTIEPHILRRMKSQIAHKLPGKIDKVIFVTLSGRQHDLYVKALQSSRIRKALIDGKGMLGAIDHLRKICNHPFLVEKNNRELDLDGDLDEDSIETSRLVQLSCKMVAMMSFLDQWKEEGRKAIVFSQTVQMQNIIERAMSGFKYLKMSGGTPMHRRSVLVEQFNRDPSIFIFLLTTRVGGLGLNLTGASRIILYDPDWNPSTDNQAKERIYRYGQKQDVEIYRIICRSTLEERIYQKQIYKNCLSRKILSDPGTRMSKEAVSRRHRRNQAPRSSR